MAPPAVMDFTVTVLPFRLKTVPELIEALRNSRFVEKSTRALSDTINDVLAKAAAVSASIPLAGIGVEFVEVLLLFFTRIKPEFVPSAGVSR